MDWTAFKKFAKAALIRAGHTFLQAVIATAGVGGALGDVDWRKVISTALLAALISLCKSAAVGLPEVKDR